MILIVHAIFGATIGSVVKNIPLAIILAFLSHYFLDLFPHVEYNIENLRNKKWGEATPDILRIILDFYLGVLAIALFSKDGAIIYVCALAAMLPDGLTALKYIAPGNKILEAHYNFHQKLHFLRDKKISNFWRIATQAAVVIISIVLLKL